MLLVLLRLGNQTALWVKSEISHIIHIIYSLKDVRHFRWDFSVTRCSHRNLCVVIKMYKYCEKYSGVFVHF